MRKFILAVSAITMTLMTSVAAAQAKPEDVIRYRQSVYKVMGWNFGPMAAMIKGEKPYDKEAFARHAMIVGQMAPLAMEGFAAGSDKGAETKAKPEIWAKSADFKEKMDKMVAETGKLATVARSGSFDEIKKQFGATGGACKACHDDYKSK
ncbi:MAG: cytochrome c [Betaproteobacteria bacterium]